MHSLLGGVEGIEGCRTDRCITMKMHHTVMITAAIGDPMEGQPRDTVPAAWYRGQRTIQRDVVRCTAQH